MDAKISKSELVWLPLVAAALLVIYLPGLGNELVFDDLRLTDGTLNDYASIDTLRVRMLSFGSFPWLGALLGEGWWKQRLVNVALHLGVVVALWALYREILRCIELPPANPANPATEAGAYFRSPALGLAVGFFALNPVAVYAVGYLVQRSIVMATLFVALALWLFVRGVRERRPGLLAGAVACYLLALASKETALLAPAAAIPLYILAARPAPRRLLLIAGAGAAIVALASVALYLRYGEIIGQPFDEFSGVYLSQLDKLDPDTRRHAYPLSILNQAYLFFEYGLRWLLPAADWMSINLRPPFPVKFLTFPQVLGIVGYVAVLAGGFWMVLRHRDWRALVGASVLMPALMFGTEFITVWVQDPFVLYRSYLWAIGVPGIVFYFLHGPSGRWLAAIAIVVGSLLAWQAFDRVTSMRTAVSVFSDAIEKLPEDPRSVGRWFPYVNRGNAYLDRNEVDLAIRDFQAASGLGDLGIGAFNTGSLLASKGKPAEALAWFDLAAKQGNGSHQVNIQRGFALVALRRLDEAYDQFRIARWLNPPSPDREVVALHFGRLALQTGRKQEAIEALEQLVAWQPGSKEGRYLLGMALVSGGQPQRALPVLDALIRDDPRAAPAFYARALANAGLKRKAQALEDIESAIRLDPANAGLREWQAKIRAMP